MENYNELIFQNLAFPLTGTRSWISSFFLWVSIFSFTNSIKLQFLEHLRARHLGGIDHNVMMNKIQPVPCSFQIGEMLATVSLNSEILWVYRSIIPKESTHTHTHTQPKQQNFLYFYLNKVRISISKTELCPLM